jgi:hypothetical protein
MSPCFCAFSLAASCAWAKDSGMSDERSRIAIPLVRSCFSLLFAPVPLTRQDQLVDVARYQKED